VDDAVAQGADLLMGGRMISTATTDETHRGQFYPPTVLSRVRPGMKIWQEEVFGPVGGCRVLQRLTGSF
jgi:acyl-CoA reductase-like NAD-dependent aldehyde dehydrogenase